MAGYHVVHRATDAANYIAVASLLKLPTDCGCRADSSVYDNDGVFPEFFFGFYKGYHGLDIGILYRGQANYPKNFRLFCCGFPNTVDNTYHYNEKVINLTKGTTITVRAYLDGSDIVLKVDGYSTHLRTPLTADAINTFRKGARINRELTCASNTDNFIPSDAFFTETIWSYTTLTTNAYTYHKLSDTNSSAQSFPDYGSMDGSRYGYVNLGDVNGFSKDCGSCDFR